MTTSYSIDTFRDTLDTFAREYDQADDRPDMARILSLAWYCGKFAARAQPDDAEAAFVAMKKVQTATWRQKGELAAAMEVGPLHIPGWPWPRCSSDADTQAIEMISGAMRVRNELREHDRRLTVADIMERATPRPRADDHEDDVKAERECIAAVRKDLESIEKIASDLERVVRCLGLWTMAHMGYADRHARFAVQWSLGEFLAFAEQGELLVLRTAILNLLGEIRGINEASPAWQELTVLLAYVCGFDEARFCGDCRTHDQYFRDVWEMADAKVATLRPAPPKMPPGRWGFTNN